MTRRRSNCGTTTKYARKKEERGCMLAVMGQWLNGQMKQTPRITCNGPN